VKGKLLHRIWVAYQEGGVRLVARKTVDTLHCEVVLYVFDLERDLPDVSSDVPLEARELSPSDVEKYVVLRPEEDAERVLARLRDGHVCCATWVGDRIVGCAWVRFDEIWVSEIGKSMSLQPGEVYGYDSYTDPGYRARGAASMRAMALLRHVKRLGYRRLVGYVMCENTAGRVALETLGFVRSGRIRWLHVSRNGLLVSSGRSPRPRVGVHVRPRRAQEWSKSASAPHPHPQSGRCGCG
jgi:RimJ/RimL family protein N-acetyltransferase